MAKYTVVGDPHIKPSNLEQITKLFEMVEDLGNPAIWLGDMLDTKELVRSKCFNALYAYLKKSKLKHSILVGNHDWHNLECKEHSLLALQELGTTNIVDKPEPNLMHNALFMPYYHDLEAFKADIKKWGADRKTLFMHQGLNGFDFGNGYIEENGLDVDSITGFDCVISGHFHMFQELPEKNLTFVGTPFTHSHGETESPKHIAIFDSEAAKIVEYIPTPFPRHITIEFNCETGDLNNLKAIVDSTNYYRIILTGSEQSVMAFNKSEFPKVKFLERPTDTMTSTISETASNEEKFQRWATEIKKLDSETLALGMEILREVK